MLWDVIGRCRRRVVLTAGVLGVLAAACEKPSLIHLDTLADEIDHPTGDLVNADVHRVAYGALAVLELIDAFTWAGAQIPGIRQSGQFAAIDASACTTAQGDITVDFGCMGGRGRLKVKVRNAYPNDNGDYDLDFDHVSKSASDALDGAIAMRVEGISNPDILDRELLSLTLTLTDAPESYEKIEDTGLLVRNGGVDNGVRGLRYLEDVTFVFDHVKWLDAGIGFNVHEIGFNVHDRKNMWTCTATFTGQKLTSGECRTPMDGGDYGILHF